MPGAATVTRLVVVAAMLLAPTARGSEPDLPQVDWQAGWLALAGDDLEFGWQQVGEATWAWEDGAIVSDGRPGWLMTTTEWADFELELDFRTLDPEANSGIFIRSALEPTDPTDDCYEVNIAPADHPYPTGSLVGRQRTELPPPESGQPPEWVHLRIVAEGDRIQVFRRADAAIEDTNLKLVFGETKVADFTDPDPIAKGYIGLQSNEGRVAFKNVHIKPLGTEPLFNGQDLTGWKTDQAGPAEFRVTDAGELQVLGGSGQAESEGEYGDFILQFECKTNGDGLNSGVFFRCIPGDRMNGYECQIHNGYRDGDRSQPADFGTGGIYRRTPARRVVADDHQWFGVTIHANGPHFAVWVNGQQVTDWTDTREPHENPRQGLRLEPGTFCIQAHDPTTDLLFRNLRVVELP